MSPSSCEFSKAERRRIRAEAAAWLARLHGPNRTPALEHGLRQWLAEHPLHAREFELATDAWESIGPRGILPPRPPRSAPRPRLARLIGPIVAAAAAGILIGLWLMRTGTETLRTGVGDQKTVILADGSRITLNTNTRLLLRYGKHTRNVTLKYGEAYFDVVHNPTRPFIVRAGEQKVIDLGTRFIVDRSATTNAPLTVTVLEGRVAVASADTPIAPPSGMVPEMHIVTAGHLFRFRPHALPTIRTVSADEATAWLNGQLIFDGTPLADAAAQFNRYNTTQLRVVSPQDAAIPVGGVFRIGDSASFARAVAASHHLTVVVRGSVLLIEPSIAPPQSAKSHSF